MKQFFLTLGLAFAFANAFAQNGVLDANFNSTGIVNNAVGSANAIAVDPSGNTVVCGHDRNSSTKNVYVYRYNSSGQLDNTFGVAGAVTFDLNTDYDYGRSIKALSNGKYLICGQNSVGPYFRGYVAKLNSNGTSDLSFGNADTLIINSNQSNMDVWAMDVASNGTIYAAGYVTVNTIVRAAVWKISANGVVDQTFGFGGVASINSSNYGDRLFSIDYNENNHLLAVTGVSTNVSTPEGLIALMDTTGQLKTSFNNLGYATVAQSANPTTLYDVCLRNQSLVVCGFHLNGANNNALMAAFDLSGNPLNGFASSGVFTDNLSSLSSFNQIDEDCQGSLYLGGHLFYNAMKSFYIAKFSSNGQLDANFASNGQFVTRLNASYDEFIEGMALHGNNGIVACGRTNSGASSTRSGLIKVSVSACGGSSIHSDLAAAQVGLLYPNPIASNQVLNVYSPTAISNISFINALGQMVYSQNDLAGQIQHALTLPALSPGVYQVLINADNTTVKTLVVQ